MRTIHLFPTLLLLLVSLALAKRPNFILIMTDDQDLYMDSVSYQPAVQKHFAQQGTQFVKHFFTVSICYPSRVSLITGWAAHNTNVTDVVPPYGGYPKFIDGGWNDKHLGVWLQDEGYNTYYTGKMMNRHSTETYDKPRMRGWSGSDFLLDPGTYVNFYNSTWTRNNEPYRNTPNEYSTDVIANNSISFLNDAIADSPEHPFFLGIAPVAPHGQTTISARPPILGLPIPAKRHAHLFPNATVPRTPNFNPSTPGTASYLKALRQLNATEIEYNDAWYRAGLQTLVAVDELIESVMSRLEASPEVLENTYIIYTTDNGYHMGQHRLPPGKSCSIEEDINIPFFIRGPDVPKNETQRIPSSHTDIVPTLFALAGIPLQSDFDGEIIPVTRALLASNERSEHVNVEFWGENYVEGNLFYGQDRIKNNTYKALRVVGDEYDLSYTVWCTGDHELYDVAADQYQLENLLAPGNAAVEHRVNGWDVPRLAARLDALLLTLKRCKGEVCRKPWATLHPDGCVKNLKDAMSGRFDRFYESEQRKVTFDECALGQILSVEGALEPVSWRDEWSEWRKF